MHSPPAVQSSGDSKPAQLTSFNSPTPFSMLPQLPATSVRLRDEEEGGGYRGVAAPKRKRVEDGPVVEEIPKVGGCGWGWGCMGGWLWVGGWVGGCESGEQ
jgi:hypothetical protein